MAPTAGDAVAGARRAVTGAASEPVTRWERELTIARRCARSAGVAIRPDFGSRHIVAYKGRYDVQLRADLVAQREIVDCLTEVYPDHGIIAEEGMQAGWASRRLTWAVDPLDGTNNFGYGIAHCAVAISLFNGDDVALALVFDPILEREFWATEDMPYAGAAGGGVALEHATVSLVTDYSPEGRQRGRVIAEVVGERCKRVFSLWAPALDLALVASGAMDAMVCRRASFLDVCAGMFLVRSAGGVVLGVDDTEMDARRSLHQQPVSFVAARSGALARQLMDLVGPLLSPG